MNPILLQAVADYGLWAVGAVIFGECLGVPLPGQAILVAAAIFAGMGGGLDITLLVVVAAVTAFLGSQASFALARHDAVDRLILAHGHRVGFGAKRRAAASRLFARFGAAIVFFGRFVAVLRTFSGLIAGMMRMPPLPFLIANLAGSAAWALVIGLGSYILGDAVRSLSREIQIIGGAVVVAVTLAVLWAFRRYERHLDKAGSAEDDRA